MSEQQNWYYLTDTNEQKGPVAESEIRQLITSGSLSGKTLMWNPDLSDWIALEMTPFNELLRSGKSVSKSETGNQKKSPAGLWIALIASFVVILAMGVVIALLLLRSSKAHYEGPGFDSAEAAAEAFAKAYSEKDIDGMYKACAIESYVEHYDLEGLIEHVQSYLPNKFYLYGKSDATAALNARLRETELTRNFYNLFETPVWNHSDLADQRGMVISLEKTGMKEITGLLEGVDAIDRIKVKEVETVSTFCDETGQQALKENYFRDGNKKNMSAWERIYDGKIEDLAVLMEIDGDRYYLFLQTISYDGKKWYVLNTHGTLASILGLDVYSGGLCPASELREGFGFLTAPTSAAAPAAEEAAPAAEEPMPAEEVAPAAEEPMPAEEAAPAAVDEW